MSNQADLRRRAYRSIKR